MGQCTQTANCSCAKNVSLTQSSSAPSDSNKTIMQNKIEHQLQNHSEFICGWGAAIVNISVTFPINKVMFRQQLTGVRVYKAFSELQKEGLRNLYRGIVPPLIQKSTSMSLMFGAYYNMQRVLSYEFPNMWTPVNRASSAVLAGGLEAVLTPFERIQVLMQDRHYYNRFNNTVHAFKELRSFGFKEYYRGQTAIVYRNCLSNVAFFLIRDYLMETYPKSKTNSIAKNISQDFISGALLGACISTVFYPLNVVKVKMQSNLGGEFTSMWATAKVVMKERDYNYRKLFRGVHINYTRSFISWGITNATYEFLMSHVFKKERSHSS